MEAIPNTNYQSIGLIYEGVLEQLGEGGEGGKEFHEHRREEKSQRKKSTTVEQIDK